MWIYILLRTVIHKRHQFVEGDELRHMTCAKDFYKLWNKSTYDMHPPLYSWLMRFLRGVGDYYAGVIVSFLCSIGLYLVCSRLYDVLGLTPIQKTTALLCLAFNYTLIYYSNRAFRYQLIALLGASTMYLLLVHNYLAAGICWGLLGLTCTYAGLRGFWIWLFLGINPISLLAYIIVFGSWLYTKWDIYRRNNYYPCGVDGKIEPTRAVTFREVLSPLYFPWTYAYYGKKELGYNFRNWFNKIGGVFGLYQLKNKQLNIIISIFTIIFGYFTVKGMLLSSWPVVLLAIVLLYPSLMKRFLPRNSIMAIPLLCYFLAKGFPILSNLWLYFALGGSLLGYFWFNRVFCLFKPRIKGREVSRYLDSLPKDGVLVEGMIAYHIAYRTKKRVVCIPHDPIKQLAIFQTNLSISEFRLSYIVFSDLWRIEEHAGYPAIEYIKESFDLIKTIDEDGDRYYIYEIPIY